MRSVPARQNQLVYELEVTEGLEPLSRQEVIDRLGVAPRAIMQGRGWLRFPAAAEAGLVTDLRLAESAFLVLGFDVPRPRALLGDAHFRRLQTNVMNIISNFRPRASSFYVAAAGAESSVMLRLRAELGRALGLADGIDEGDVQLRLLRARESEGWDVLIRLTPRPLAARSWRVCSFPGALNATVARAIALLTRPREDDVFVNLLSGSGSILIERRLAAPAGQTIGIELAAERVVCAERNLAAAGLGNSVTLMQADATNLPMNDRTASALAADLPFGQKVGRHDDNLSLYPAVLTEAARVARPGARFALITHEVRLIERLLREQRWWDTEQDFRVTLRGLHPRLYVLKRR